MNDKITIPVGFKFYNPDPKKIAWHKNDEELRKQKGNTSITAGNDFFKRRKRLLSLDFLLIFLELFFIQDGAAFRRKIDSNLGTTRSHFKREFKYLQKETPNFLQVFFRLRKVSRDFLPS